MIAYLKAGLWDSIKKFTKILLWIAFGAIINVLVQLWFNFQPHDIALTIAGYDITITAAMLNVAMTGFWNAFGAGFVKWATTKANEAKSTINVTGEIE
jgi:hypothetical protein